MSACKTVEELSHAPITILEGPDGAGKTHLAREMHPDACLAHHGPYPGEEDVWFRYLRSLVIPEVRGMDRSWISEPIYGEVMRGGEDRVHPWQRRMLERVALARRAAVVLCLPRWETVRANYLARKGEEYVDRVGGIRRVWRRYAELADRHPVLPTYLFDYETDDPAELAAWMRGTRPRRNEGPGIGHWNPERVTLLVGDRTNLGASALCRGLPFVAAGGCSPWLAQHLERWDIPESRLYWVNALDVEDTPTDPEFIWDLRPRRIVALGTAARSWLRRRAGLSERRFDTVEHPQYWKRFQHRKPYPLGEMLYHDQED